MLGARFWHKNFLASLVQHPPMKFPIVLIPSAAGMNHLLDRIVPRNLSLLSDNEQDAKFCLAVHFTLLNPDDIPIVELVKNQCQRKAQAERHQYAAKHPHEGRVKCQ